ncbi:MAG: hypothetical protein U0625_12675 [Phycisphaerales bacterium]
MGTVDELLRVHGEEVREFTFSQVERLWGTRDAAAREKVAS